MSRLGRSLLDLWDCAFIISLSYDHYDHYDHSSFSRFFLVIHAEGFVKKGRLNLKLLKQLYWLVWDFGDHDYYELLEVKGALRQCVTRPKI